MEGCGVELEFLGGRGAEGQQRATAENAIAEEPITKNQSGREK